MKLERLACLRDNILLCEIGMLLHDLGKLSVEFNEINATESGRIAFFHEMILARREAEQFPKDLPDGINPSHVSNVIKELRKLLADRESPRMPLSAEERGNVRNALIEEAYCNVLGSRIPESFPRRYFREAFTPEDFLTDEARRLLNTECISFSHKYNLNGMGLLTPDLLQTVSPVALGDFIDSEYLEKKGLSELRKPSDIMDSAGDKSSHGAGSTQDEPDFFGSTSFGMEFPLDPHEIESARAEFCKLLCEKGKSHKTLSDIISDLKSCIRPDANDWWKERRRILKAAENAFSVAIAETRRSANDVSLWHHSYAAASLFKSSIAAQLLDDSPPNKPSGNWSILSVNFSVLGLIEKAHRIGDILGYTDFVSKDLCNAIKHVIEVDCPLGNEIYRDESGIYSVAAKG